MVLLSKENLRDELKQFAQESLRNELQDMETRLKDAINGIITNAKKEPKAVDAREAVDRKHKVDTGPGEAVHRARSIASPSLEDHFDKKDRKENEVKWITRGRRCSINDMPEGSQSFTVGRIKSIRRTTSEVANTNSAMSKRATESNGWPGKMTNFNVPESSKRISADSRFSIGSSPPPFSNELSIVHPNLDQIHQTSSQVSSKQQRESSWALQSIGAFAQVPTGSVTLLPIEEHQVDRRPSLPDSETSQAAGRNDSLILETTGLLEEDEDADTANTDLWEVQRNPRMRHTLHHSHLKHSVLVEARSSEWKNYVEYHGEEPSSSVEGLQDFLSGNRFVMFSGGAIVLNIIMIGIETDYMARYWTQSVPQEIRYIDTAFCMYFLLEIVLRCIAFGFLFFTNWWNLFDLLTVCLQVGEEVTAHLSDKAPSGGNIGIVRVMRIFRLIRVMRIIRLLSAFSALRMLVVSVVDSMRSLVWTMVLIFMTMFIISVYFTQIVTDHKVKNMTDQRGEESELIVFYGTLDRTMLTLYQTISEGLHWDVAMEPLRSHCSPWMALVFSLYIAFVTFAMLNVITGIFVESAIQTANDDKKKVLMYQMRQVFTEADYDNSGTISWSEFEDQLQNPQLQSFLRVVDLDTEEAEDLFRLLDVNGENEISADEFVHGALRIHGFAKAIDLATFMHEFYRHSRRVEKALDVIYSQVKEDDPVTPR